MIRLGHAPSSGRANTRSSKINGTGIHTVMVRAQKVRIASGTETFQDVTCLRYTESAHLVPTYKSGDEERGIERFQANRCGTTDPRIVVSFSKGAVISAAPKASRRTYGTRNQQHLVLGQKPGMCVVAASVRASVTGVGTRNQNMSGSRKRE